MNSPRQRGAALITVMLIVSISTVIITALLLRQQLDIKRTSNVVLKMQAYQYALAAEELARQLLAVNTDVTYYGQEALAKDIGFDADNATIVLNIEDLQARFNINNLTGSAIAPVSDFQQLLAILNIPKSVAGSVVALLNSNTEGTTVKPVDNPSIIREIDGLSADNYQLLLPLLTALPENGTVLNVNTASDTLLKLYIADTNLYSRFTSIKAATGFATASQLEAIGMNTTGMGATSNYFRARILIKYGNNFLTMQSILKRSTNAAGTVIFQCLSRDMNGDL